MGRVSLLFLSASWCYLSTSVFPIFFLSYSWRIVIVVFEKCYRGSPCICHLMASESLLFSPDSFCSLFYFCVPYFFFSLSLIHDVLLLFYSKSIPASRLHVYDLFNLVSLLLPPVSWCCLSYLCVPYFFFLTLSLTAVFRFSIKFSAACFLSSFLLLRFAFGSIFSTTFVSLFFPHPCLCSPVCCRLQ